MGYFDMTRSEVEREMREAADREAWDAFGPKCATCRHGVVFLKSDYASVLEKDIAYCKQWCYLCEDPYESNADIQDCWEV